jgi:hypothetical protein
LSASDYSSSAVCPSLAPLIDAFTGGPSFFTAGAGALLFFFESTGA